MNETTTYQNFLNNEFLSRKLINSSYSLRAFARDIDISPSSLSLILKGSQGLSVEKAKCIAKNIGMNKEQEGLFCDLVESKHSRNKQKRKDAHQRILNQNKNARGVISLDTFSVISDWFHYAILELMSLKNFKSDSNWIARKLSISVSEVKKAIVRLENQKMVVVEKGVFRATDSDTLSPSDFTSSALKKFHKQILNKAIMAIDEQELNQRDFSSITLAFDSADMKEAKKDILNFRRSFMKKYGSSTEKNTVYNLGISFFRLTNEKDKK